MLEDIDTEKLDEDIRKFNPELVIAFNNTIYNKILELTNCPIVIWGADTEFFWNSKELIKKNIDRYHFFCFSEQEIKPRQQYFKIPDNKIFLMKPATNLTNTYLEKDKNISFIGTCFSTSENLINLIKQHQGTTDIKCLIKNFKNYFIEKNNLLENIDNIELINNFNKINKTEYSRFFSAEKRITTLLNIADLDLHIWGDDKWNNFGTYFPTLLSCVHKEKATTAKENEQIYNTSKICININHDQSINGMNFRICDVLASGGCLISSYSPFVQQQFRDIDIPMFNDSFEARALCQRFLKDETLRNELVLASNAIINKAWRWEHRFKEMSKILKVSLCKNKILDKLGFSNNGCVEYLTPCKLNN